MRERERDKSIQKWSFCGSFCCEQMTVQMKSYNSGGKMFWENLRTEQKFRTRIVASRRKRFQDQKYKKQNAQKECERMAKTGWDKASVKWKIIFVVRLRNKQQQKKHNSMLICSSYLCPLSCFFPLFLFFFSISPVLSVFFFMNIVHLKTMNLQIHFRDN